MVYLIEHIKQLQSSLEKDNLATLAYFYLKDKDALVQVDIDSFSGIEQIAAKGYLSIPITEIESQKILKPGYKGVDISSSIFKLIGAYLSDENQVSQKLNEKFEETTLRNQFLISRFSKNHRARFQERLQNLNTQESFIFRIVEGVTDLKDEDIEKISSFLMSQLDVIDLLILEELHQKLIELQTPITCIINLSAFDTFIRVLDNFHNSVKKITNRRKDHDNYKLEDEYDVQDILYVILKSIFPSLKEEDPTPKVGIKSNKIDLILREEGILLEVKMIKKTDSNEKDFVEQLKNDIQSYYNSPWLKHLIFFVYDPQTKTKDIQNFYDLNGSQTINGTTFSVTVIVNPV